MSTEREDGFYWADVTFGHVDCRRVVVELFCGEWLIGGIGVEEDDYGVIVSNVNYNKVVEE